MKYKVSIIVPVYNVENYIERCLNSIINQTLDEIEIIIINDCSTDNSINIIQQYLNSIEHNKEIILINKKYNEGVSKARNDAINISRGEYILFVDSDDWIEFNMVEKMYNLAKYKNSDLVICNAYIDYENGKTKPLELNFENNKKYENNTLIGDLLSQNKNLQGHPWNKLYKTDIIKCCNLKYNEKMSLYEDFVFNIDFLLSSNTALFLEDKLYHYIQRNNSLARTVSERNILDTNRMIIEIKNKLDKINIKNKYKYEFISFAYRSIINNILLIINSNKSFNEKKDFLDILLLDNEIIKFIEIALKLNEVNIIKYHYIIGKLLKILKFDSKTFIVIFKFSIQPILVLKNSLRKKL